MYKLLDIWLLIYQNMGQISLLGGLGYFKHADDFVFQISVFSNLRIIKVPTD